jgi:hypothetical protein
MKTHVRNLALTLAALACLAWAGDGPANPPRSNSPGTPSCSPVPCVLPPTQASEGGGLVTDTPIAANPTNGLQLLLGSTDYNCTGGSNVGEHLSIDGGTTWTRVDCMPGIEEDKRGYTALGEPSVGYDAKGNAYAAGEYQDLSSRGTYGLVGLQESTNGSGWGSPVAAVLGPGQSYPAWTRLAVDANPRSPYAGALYISTVLFTDVGNDNQVFVSHSTQGGATWAQVPVDGVNKSSQAFDNYTRATVGASGTVYVTWLHCSDPQPCTSANIMFSESRDGGNTWSTPARVAGVQMPVSQSLPHTGERMYNYPSISVDNSDGPYAGSLYVVMYNWTGAYMRVIMIRSTDGGTTWSQPIHPAPDKYTHDQFFPAISVNKNGLVGVSWLDRRNDPNDIDYQAFAAISYDGGQTFGPNWQLTTAFSNPKNNGTENNWMGDYTGNTWVGDKFIAAWMDSSNGVDMQEVVGGVQLK